MAILLERVLNLVVSMVDVMTVIDVNDIMVQSRT